MGSDGQEPRAKQVVVSDDSLRVDLADGRTIIVPLVWYPRLWYGTPAERSRFEIIGDGTLIHWPDLDEDLSVVGLLAGKRSGESPRSLKKWLESRGVSSYRRETTPSRSEPQTYAERDARPFAAGEPVAVPA